ncbi:hypothetical protein ACFSEO_16110 [Agromyces cerinus subsp. nitratus]
MPEVIHRRVHDAANSRTEVGAVRRRSGRSNGAFVRRDRARR